MAGHNLNKTVSNEAQLLLFADYHAAIELYGKDDTRSRRQRNRIVEFNRKLVHRPAKTMAHATGETQEDFEQVGIIGLIRAIERFNPSRGIRFSSYALGFIRGEMLHHVRDNPITVNPKVKRGAKDIYFRVVKLHREALLADPDVSIDEIALTLTKDNGERALTEHEWIDLQMAMTLGQAAELNEEIVAETGKPEIRQMLISGDLPTATRKCLIEVVIKQAEHIPYSDRVSIAAKKLRLTVPEVEHHTKMGLSQVRALYELALSQAEQV